jgi:chemotaxis signal transduction protein
MADDLSGRPLDESNQLLCAHLGDQEFALSIGSIREIRGVDFFHPSPACPVEAELEAA